MNIEIATIATFNMKNYDMFKSEGKTATLKKYLTKFVEVRWRLIYIISIVSFQHEK